MLYIEMNEKEFDDYRKWRDKHYSIKELADRLLDLMRQDKNAKVINSNNEFNDLTFARQATEYGKYIGDTIEVDVKILYK